MREPLRLNEKLFQPLRTLEHWINLFDNLKWIAALFYLQYLSDTNNYFGFWTVVVIFLFEPAVKCIQSIIKGGKTG